MACQDIDLYRVNNNDEGIYHILSQIIHTKEGFDLFLRISTIVANKNNLVNLVDNEGFTPLLAYLRVYNENAER